MVVVIEINEVVLCFVFVCSEYVVWIVKMCVVMEWVGIDLLIVIDLINMGWLIGYDGWLFYVY